LEAAQKALPGIKAQKQAAEKAMMAAGNMLKAAQTVLIAANKTFKEAEKKATDAKVLADKVRATNDSTKKILDDKTKVAGQSKAILEKLKKEKQDPEKKKLADLQKKIDASRKEFDKINGPLQTAIRELENANLDLERAKGEVDKAGKLKATAEQVKQNQETARDATKQAASASEKNITTTAFAPDGKSFATSGDDNMIHTWGAEKGQPFEVFGNLGQSGRLIAYAPDGSIISVDKEGKVRTWKTTPEWKLEKVIGSAVGESPIIDRVTSLDYSPDGKTLASGGGDPSRSGEVLLWNTVDAKLKLDLSGIHSDSVLDIDFSPDGSHIATAAADKFVKVTETTKGSVVRTFEGHTHHVMGVSWRRTGREILSSGADNDVKYWNFENGDRLGKGGGFKKEVTSIHYIGISSEAIATSAEGKVSVIRSGSNISQATALSGATKFVHASDVTPDGKLVAAGGQDGILRIWTIKDKKLIREFKPPEPEDTTVAEIK
jgi:WD40 repeat protein